MTPHDELPCKERGSASIAGLLSLVPVAIWIDFNGSLQSCGFQPQFARPKSGPSTLGLA